MVNSSQADKLKIEFDNLLDYFQLYLFPLALNSGMTPKQFWEDDPELFYSYMDAYEMRKKEEAIESDIKAYNQAYYFLLALQQCLQFSSNPKRIFPKKPFSKSNKNIINDMTPEEYQELRKIQLQEMVKRYNKNKKGE